MALPGFVKIDQLLIPLISTWKTVVRNKWLQGPIAGHRIPAGQTCPSPLDDSVSHYLILFYIQSNTDYLTAQSPAPLWAIVSRGERSV